MAGRFNPDNYVDVQERIVAFWAAHEYGAIRTYMMSDPNIFERVVFRAEVFKDRDSEKPDAIGWAGEEKGQGGQANNTNWHENCETSAIGRAFANMGYATNREDRPSRQEMQKVVRMQQEYSEQPPQQQAPQQMRPVQQVVQQQRQDNGGGYDSRITDRQMGFIRTMAREKGMSDDALDAQVQEIYGKSFANMDRRDASSYIERLKEMPKPS